MGEEIEFFKFSGSIDPSDKIFNTGDTTIYDFIESKLEKLKTRDISDIDIESILEKDIAKHFNNNISGISDETNRKNLLTIIPEDILNCFDKMLQYIEEKINIKFDNNVYTAFALHINTLINRINSNKIMANPNLNKIKELYPYEFKVAMNAKKIIENFIHSRIPEDEAGYMTLFLIQENSFMNEDNDKVKVILIAHGESTATSMADVASNLLGENYVIPINAPINIAPSEVLNQLRDAVKNNPTSQGYLLLVDMGSLTTFSDVIKNEFNTPIKVISLVSTLHVLEAARKASLGSTLDSLYNDVLMVNSYIETHKNLNEKKLDQNRIIIITACLTGEGAAIAIKNFLNSNLKYDKDIFQIVCLNCLDKNYFLQKIKKIQENHEILFIVCSFTIDIPIKQYTMYEAFNLSVLRELQEMIDSKTALVNIPLVIEENIPSIDGHELFNDVIRFLKNIQDRLSIELSQEKLIGTTLHISFVIGRLRSNSELTNFPNKESYIEENKVSYNIVKEEFKFLNEKYKAFISDDELCYIINILYSK